MADIFSALGSLFDTGVGLFNSVQNRNLQREQLALQQQLATSGVQMKVSDSLKAGIHPLVGLGAQTHSFSPISTGSTDLPTDMGQNISRAMKAAMSSDDRDAEELKKLTLDRARLDNDLVRSQIRASNTATTSRASGAIGPSLPTGLKTVDGHPIKTDDIKQKPSTAPAVEILRPAGIKTRTNPYMSDAQDIEDRYGEAVSDWVVGPANVVGDGVYTAYRGLKSAQGYAPARNFIRGLTRAGRR